MSRIIPTSRGVIDPNNSSTTPLGISATFTSTITDITDYGIGQVTVYSDQDSAEDGLIVEQSTDGVNFDNDDVYSIVGGIGKNFSINLHANYLRIRYTNGTVAQTAFRLTLFYINGRSGHWMHLRVDICIGSSHLA